VGSCAEILRVEESLWTFARVAGVPPTNNAAERAERHAVIWRRISGGTDSAHGSRFVERMLTVVATCRQQGRSVLDHLTSCSKSINRRCHLAGWQNDYLLKVLAQIPENSDA
jgi:transposase